MNKMARIVALRVVERASGEVFRVIDVSAYSERNALSIKAGVETQIQRRPDLRVDVVRR